MTPHTDRRPAAFRSLGVTTIIAALAISAAPALAEYPERPITLIVPLSAGGPTDILARALASALDPILGQSVIVENRTGAGGQVAYEYAVQQPADGYSLVMNTVSIGVLPLTNPSFTLDPATSFAPVTMFEERAVPIIVRANEPYTTFEEFVAHAREHAGELNYAAGGAADELAAAWLDQVTGMQTERIRYAGAAPSVAALLGGEVDYHMTFLGNVRGHVESGALRLIAIGGRERSPELPDVPAVAEFYPDYAWTSYTGILAPAGTPAEIVDRLNAAVREALATPELQQTLAVQGTNASPMSPAEYAVRLAADRALWERIADEAGLEFN